jgi:hypothetical protein
MRSLVISGLMLAAIGLTACGGTTVAEPMTVNPSRINSSNFTQGNTTGPWRPNVSNTQAVSDRVGTSGIGYNAAAGVRGRYAFGAEARLLIPTGTGVSALPTEAAVQYQGPYQVAIINNADQRVGIKEKYTGTISLTANLNSGAFTGTDRDLTIAGNLTGNDLGGTATFRDITGPLKGLVGGDVALGIFHASTDNVVFAGGFLAQSR